MPQLLDGCNSQPASILGWLCTPSCAFQQLTVPGIAPNEQCLRPSEHTVFAIPVLQTRSDPPELQPFGRLQEAVEGKAWTYLIPGKNNTLRNVEG